MTNPGSESTSNLIAIHQIRNILQIWTQKLIDPGMDLNIEKNRKNKYFIKLL